LSALFTGGDNSGELYNILASNENAPKAARLTDTHWVWTVSSSVSGSYINGNLNISVNFPVNQTHYIIIHGVRPFLNVRLHDINFRTDSQFERYDSSGWVYYSQDQVLILKLKHRVTVENISIIYRQEPQPVVVDETAGVSVREETSVS
jgi:hypothetical protein